MFKQLRLYTKYTWYTLLQNNRNSGVNMYTCLQNNKRAVVIKTAALFSKAYYPKSIVSNISCFNI